MAMKPSTFNRIILASTLAAFLVTGGVAAVVLMGSTSITRTKSQQAVHEWLVENLNNPDYEAVKWYDPVAYKGAGSTLVRLKFRGTTPFGGKILKDMVFDVKDGKVTESGFSDLPTECVDDLFSGAVSPDDVDNVLRAPLEKAFILSIFADAKAKKRAKS